MHNTMLNWHYCYGLIPFCFFVYRHICCFAYCFKKKNYLFLIVMITTTLRAITDETEFAFGCIWTYIWMLSINEKQLKSLDAKNEDKSK